MKKRVIVLVLVLLLVAVGGYGCYRLKIRGTDIIGVTTLPDKNTVIMNAKTGEEFEAGTGYITVADGEMLHLEHNLTAGSFDIAFRKDEDAFNLYESIGTTENLSDTLQNLPTSEEMTGEGSFGDSQITGSGSFEFDAEPGNYTVYITNHNAIGKATVTAIKA